MVRKFVLVCILFIAIGCSTSRQMGHYDGKFASKKYLLQLIDHLPAQDSLQANLINDAILQQGPDAVFEICNMLRSIMEQEVLNAQYALSGIATYVSKTRRAKGRAVFLEAIHKALSSDFDIEHKAFLIDRLQLIGNNQSVSILSSYLNDPYLSEAACRAMVSINSVDCGPALHKKLKNVPANHRINIIKSLGDLQYLPAAEDIAVYTQDEDIEMRMTSLFALANMGYKAAQPLFIAALQEENPYLKNQIALLYLHWAKRESDQDLLISICNTIIENDTNNFDRQIRIAAITTLVQQQREKSIDCLMDIVDAEDKNVRVAALQLTKQLQGGEIISHLLQKLQEADSDIRCEIIYILADRDEEEAYAAIISALQDQEKSVRLAAIPAAAKSGGNKSVPKLLELLAESEDSEEHKSIKEALMRLTSEDMIKAVVDRLATMPIRAKITCLEILTERRAEEYKQIIWDQLNHDSLAVRVAALEALKYFADAAGYDKILSHLLQCSEPVEKKAAQNLAVAIASKMDDIQQQIDPVSNYNKLADIEDKEYFFNILQRIGGKQGIQIILDAIESNIPEIKDKAVRTLTNWPDRTAIEPLFQLAGSDFELTYKILAIRGVLRILREHEFDIQRKIDTYARLMSIAERTDEKKLILAAMATIKAPNALKYVAQYINDNELGGDATQSILAMAAGEVTNEKNLRGDEVALALIEYWTGENWREKLLAIIQDKNTHNQPPEGFVALFNGTDLSAWKGLVANPVERAQMSPQEMQQAQTEADALIKKHWKVINGVLYFDGKGHSICTAKDYADFELFVDWKIERDGDSGIYLRGTPQVQIWDPRENPVGSGGLFNNQTGLSKPLKTADNPVGEWNTYRIIMKGNKVTVYLNDVLVVDDVVMENYWERDKEIYASGPIELQAHNTPLYFRNIFIKELEPEKLLVKGALFNGTDLHGWRVINGFEDSWQVKDGILYTEGAGGGWLSTTKEFKDFLLELEFRVPPGGNSGVFLRASHEGDPAYNGMEIQVLDDFAPEYENLKSWQYTGSIYGVEAPAMSASKSANQWQKMEILCNGPEIKVILNGQTIIDTNLIAHMFMEKEHPGLKHRKGYIGLQNHSSKIEYRNIRIKELE